MIQVCVVLLILNLGMKESDVGASTLFDLASFELIVPEGESFSDQRIKGYLRYHDNYKFFYPTNSETDSFQIAAFYYYPPLLEMANYASSKIIREQHLFPLEFKIIGEDNPSGLTIFNISFKGLRRYHNPNCTTFFASTQLNSSQKCDKKNCNDRPHCSRCHICACHNPFICNSCNYCSTCTKKFKAMCAGCAAYADDTEVLVKEEERAILGRDCFCKVSSTPLPIIPRSNNLYPLCQLSNDPADKSGQPIPGAVDSANTTSRLVEEAPCSFQTAACSPLIFMAMKIMRSSRQQEEYKIFGPFTTKSDLFEEIKYRSAEYSSNSINYPSTVREIAFYDSLEANPEINWDPGDVVQSFIETRLPELNYQEIYSSQP